MCLRLCFLLRPLFPGSSSDSDSLSELSKEIIVGGFDKFVVDVADG